MKKIDYILLYYFINHKIYLIKYIL